MMENAIKLRSRFSDQRRQMPVRRKSTLLMGILFIAIGIIWSLQGSGLIGGNSFMSDNPTFIYVGSFVSLIGFLLLVASYRPGSATRQSGAERQP